jgi:predicted dehydrogenase
MTRLALWSAGNHAVRNILPAVADAAGVTLVGILSRNKGVVREQCAKYHCRTWNDADDMLADTDVDTVICVSPNGLHVEQGVRVLEAGKHFWCEKSLAPTLAGAKALIEIADERGLVIAEAFMFAYHPQFIALRELLASGSLGRIISVTSRFGFPHLDAENIRYSKALGGGALLDVGAYCVAAPLLLLGEAPFHATGHVSFAPGYEVDIGGSAILRFADGTTAIGDWGFGRSYRNEIEVWCERGFVRLDRAFSKPVELNTTLDIVLQNQNERRTVGIDGGDNHFARMLEYFSAAAGDERRRQCLSRQVLNQAEVLEILQSASRMAAHD